MSFIPSPQQSAFFDFVDNGSGNAFVEAVAGAGKTTSLVQACKRMKGNVVFVAYNTKNVEEIKERLITVGSKALAGTFHSFGYGAWRKMYPNVKLDLNGEKYATIFLTHNIPEEYHGFIKKSVSMAKQRALGVFGQINDVKEWDFIINRFDLMEELDENMSVEDAINYSIKTLTASNVMCKQIIDFDDMIYAPVLFGARMYQNDFVLVDEAQDTNPARRAIARKMVKPNGRIIFVGDRHQAIFGFTGADAEAVQIIINEFNCTTLPLTVTYRCPKNVVNAAKAYVNHIEAHETAPDGEVTSIQKADFEKHYGELTNADAIICRKTAPLVDLAFTLIRRSIPCHVEGRDIAAGLTNLLKKWKIKSVDKYLDKLEKWEEIQVQKAIAKGNDMQADSIKDRCATIRVLCEGLATIQDVEKRINTMFKDTEGKKVDTLTLSTAHKSKGREWRNVYVLGFNEFMPSRLAKQEWQKEQEKNLIYVSFTRAKNKLTLVG